jgi:hypothetical protein
VLEENFMSINILRKSGMLAGLLVASMLMVLVVACGGDDAETSSSSSSSAAPAAPAAPKAPAAPQAAAKPEAPKAAAPAAKAESKATKAASASKSSTSAPSGPSGKLIRAHHEVNPVFGTPWSGPYKWSAADLIGIGEHLFYFDKGNAMTPQMANLGQ